jgi:hypothetical protein
MEQISFSFRNFISLSESIGVVEGPKMLLGIFAKGILENVQLLDSVVLNVKEQVAIQELLSIREEISTSVKDYVITTDSLTIQDVPQLNLKLRSLVQDAIFLIENTTIRSNVNPDVRELLSTFEALDIALTIPGLNLSDIVNLVEQFKVNLVNKPIVYSDVLVTEEIGILLSVSPTGVTGRFNDYLVDGLFSKSRVRGRFPSSRTIGK